MVDRTMAARFGSLRVPFALVWSDRHRSHQVRARGHVERPARVAALLESVGRTGLFTPVKLRHFGEGHVLAVHDRDLIEYMKAVCRTVGRTEPVCPYVFPSRDLPRPPRNLDARAGYYCCDTITPLDEGAYEAARAAVDVALTAADELLHGRRVAYALCRPPGHHAERRVFGGFCYLNNAAIAAHFLSRHGRVAVLDIDLHHGNGTQDIFSRRSDVLTVSIHGDPTCTYPYVSGFKHETGEGEGRGYNRNFPLPESADEAAYLRATEQAVRLIGRFAPTFLVVSLGLDTMARDPAGGFGLRPSALHQVGRRIGCLGLPTLVVQEGGYSLRNLRSGAAAFFTGMADAAGRPDASCIVRRRRPQNGAEDRDAV